MAKRYSSWPLSDRCQLTGGATTVILNLNTRDQSLISRACWLLISSCTKEANISAELKWPLRLQYEKRVLWFFFKLWKAKWTLYCSLLIIVATFDRDSRLCLECFKHLISWNPKAPISHRNRVVWVHPVTTSAGFKHLFKRSRRAKPSCLLFSPASSLTWRDLQPQAELVDRVLHRGVYAGCCAISKSRFLCPSKHCCFFHHH